MFQTLRRGDRGPLVSYLQSTLNRLGFNSGQVDGIFGASTENAVLRFQRRMSLSADGIVGPETWAALEPYMRGYTFRKVRQGDTFYKLAQEYSTSVQAIIEANPDADPLNLQVGQKIVIPILSNTVPTDVPYSYEIMEFNLENLKTRYPFLEIFSVGNSGLGKKLYCVRLGSGPKEVFYNAAHHANEWITSVVLMKYIEQYANAVVNSSSVGGESAEELFETCSIYVMPMVNPDGVDLVTGAYGPDSAQYRAASRLNNGRPGFPDNWSANLAGVDLNLNYPAMWEKAKQIKYSLGYTSPGPFWYVGPYPLSEPETQAVARLTRAHNFRLILAYHSQGEVIYWRFADYNPPNSLSIAEKLSAVSGYRIEDTPEASAYAGYKDWFIQENNLPGYTIEVGLGKNPLPISQFPEIYRDNVGLLSLAAILAE